MPVTEVYVDCGNGGWWCESVLDWAAQVMACINFAIYMTANGTCKCGCDHRDCAYCVSECWADGGR